MTRARIKVTYGGVKGMTRPIEEVEIKTESGYQPISESEYMQLANSCSKCKPVWRSTRSAEMNKSYTIVYQYDFDNKTK